MSSGDSTTWCHGDRQAKVVVLGAPNRSSVRTEYERLRPSLAANSEIVAEDFEFTFDFTDCDADVVIVIGGDGSILQSARQMGLHQIPVLGVNCGTLGFLAAISPEEFLDAWPRVCVGHFTIVRHLMLNVEILRGDTVVAQQLALNEAAVLGGPPYTILDIDLYADGELATQYRCDGLIIATPVGSTAHNLSAGGPILRRHLQAVTISPISPHTLTYRPVVDSADTTFELIVSKPHETTGIVVDGRVLKPLQSGDRVRIHRAPVAFEMLNVPGQNDYRTLREKLGWGGTLRLRR
ncbi:MAG: NAD(+)/NADH kinase [Planctomycetota bacterium]